MKKKLIEVGLPLDVINDASAYDKMPGIGAHPKGIHHWWARLPLPTARAILFASVVDDPSSCPEKWPSEEMQNRERERLFEIIRKMMGKKLHERPEVYQEAMDEMLLHCDGRLPAVYDPFAGGGTIPLEANRMGFEAIAGDLNPIAVLLNKCNLELAPRWTNRAPLNPDENPALEEQSSWRGTHGLAKDIRFYAGLVGERARKSIGSHYPKYKISKELAKSRPDLKGLDGKELQVVAWIWARTVASPNPALRGKHIPLVSTFWLSNKKGKEVWLNPIVSKATSKFSFEIEFGAPKSPAKVRDGTKRGRGSNFECLLSGTALSEDYVRDEGLKGRFGMTLLAVVGTNGRGRVYLPATPEHLKAAAVEAPEVDSGEMPNNARWFSPPLVGLKTYTSVFTDRQLLAMVALGDLVKDVFKDVKRDAKNAGFSEEESEAYAQTVVTFLALAVDRLSDFNNSLCRWSPSNQKVMNLFGRQAIPMMWDFAEANILGDSVGAWETCSEYVADCVEVLSTGVSRVGTAAQLDAATGTLNRESLLISTDPPYYDNIGYAALSDFFYVWLRKSVSKFYPELFNTMMVPKMPELTASSERFGGNKNQAKIHFESGFRNAFTALRKKMDHQYPLTVYYAFKQDDDDGTEDAVNGEPESVDLTTGWETLLEALISSGFQITGTWPVRASQKWRMVSMGTNALASYIVLACRVRSDSAAVATRRDFLGELKRELPTAIRHLQLGNIAPVDLAQASIGPAMAVYSKYSKVLESDDSPMKVRSALSLINQVLDETLTDSDSVLDPESRWAVNWFEQHAFEEGEFGDANILAQAKNVSVSSLADAGIVKSRGGKVALVQREKLDDDWFPDEESTINHWIATQHLIQRLLQHGEVEAGVLLRAVGNHGDTCRDLAYRCFSLCERKGWAQEATAYNSLVMAWPEIRRYAASESVGSQKSFAIKEEATHGS